MTQEEKELLLKDLCARLPYGIIVHTDCGDMALDRNHRGIGVLYYEHYNEEAKKRCGYDETDFSIILSGCYYGDIKPYLRPMSSMTDEEKQEYKHLIAFSGNPDGAANFVDWLNKKMFAYRTIDGKDKDMFELGIAIRAPEGMYK